MKSDEERAREWMQHNAVNVLSIGALLRRIDELGSLSFGGKTPAQIMAAFKVVDAVREWAEHRMDGALMKAWREYERGQAAE